MTSLELLDEELESCMRELMRNSHEDYSNVHVHVDAQNVYFTGVLESDQAKKHLEEMAKMVNGVGSVINDVTLKH